MRNRATAIIKIWLLTALVWAGTPLLYAQSSSRVWFVVNNGAPTPSSDVAVRQLNSDGSGVAMVAGTAGTFVSQTNFLSFNTPADIVVDPAMGKVYVLDNNLQTETPEYIYSFDLAGTAAQIAASAQIIYTMPVPSADVSANLYPLISGIALDPAHHLLYFSQIDVTTATNSYIGRLDLASSSMSDVYASATNTPTLQTYYVGQVPGQGPIAIDATNIYIGAINARNGNDGVFAAPLDGSGTFSELVTVSAGDTTFTNGLVSGVASDPQDHLIYYLTFNAGYVNYNFDTSQNAIWVYNTATHSGFKLADGYPGYPDNLAVDPANRRYYFTVGRDGTGNASPTNYQAIYTGSLNSTDAPTLFYTPRLSGEDVAGQPNTGNVALQGIYVQDSPVLSGVAATASYAAFGPPVVLSPNLVVSDPSSSLIASATVAIVGGIFAGDGDMLSATTNGTGITANYNSQTEMLTLSGNDTLAHYQEVLRTVAFSSTNSDPTLNNAYPTRTISWSITDGSLSSTAAATTLAISTLPAPPTNQMSILATLNGWILLFRGTAGQSYVVQSAPSVAGPWNDLSPVLTANSAGLIGYTDQILPSPQSQFYRTRTSP